MTEHTKYECKCTKEFCQFCDGGLFACTVCGGFEGTLTTECCGRKLTKEEEDRIYNKADLDFKDGKWVNEPNYPRSWMTDKTHLRTVDVATEGSPARSDS